MHARLEKFVKSGFVLFCGVVVFLYWYLALGMIGCAGVRVPYPSIPSLKGHRVECPKEDVFVPTPADQTVPKPAVGWEMYSASTDEHGPVKWFQARVADRLRLTASVRAYPREAAPFLRPGIEWITDAQGYLVVTEVTEPDMVSAVLRYRGTDVNCVAVGVVVSDADRVYVIRVFNSYAPLGAGEGYEALRAAAAARARLLAAALVAGTQFRRVGRAAEEVD